MQKNTNFGCLYLLVAFGFMGMLLWWVNEQHRKDERVRNERWEKWRQRMESVKGNAAVPDSHYAVDSATAKEIERRIDHSLVVDGFDVVHETRCEVERRKHNHVAPLGGALSHHGLAHERRKGVGIKPVAEGWTGRNTCFLLNGRRWSLGHLGHWATGVFGTHLT